MALVVLLRGANLGKRRFSPKALVVALEDIDAVNIGAAGTFVIHKRVAETTLRKRVQAELPWEDAEMVILKDKEVRDALAAGEKVKVPPGGKRFGIAIAKRPTKTPAFPLEAKAKDGKWAMRYELLSGRVLVGVRRRFDETGPYSTKEMDDAVGLGPRDGTMRDWPTWEKIGGVLDA